MLLDLLPEDLHGTLEELRHGLHHLDESHLVVAAAVLVALLKAAVTVKAGLVVVRLVDEDEACRQKISNSNMSDIHWFGCFCR